MSLLSDVSLEKMIDKVLVEKSQNNDRDYSHFHPSEFYACHRKLVYKYYEYQGICSPSDAASGFISPQLQRIFDNGHGIHFRLGKNLESTGLLKGKWRCKTCSEIIGADIHLGVLRPAECPCGDKRFQYLEVKFVNHETMISGNVDAVLDLRGHFGIPKEASDEDGHIIIDFKSMRSEVFRRLIAPKDSHYIQMQTYLYLSGLKVGKFLYENKNDQIFREFLVNRDEGCIKQIVSDGRMLKQIVTNTNSDGKHTLPKRAHKKNNTKECVECTFRSHCWGLK